MVDKCLLSNKRTESVIRYWRGVVCCPKSAQRDLPIVSAPCQAFVGSDNHLHLALRMWVGQCLSHDSGFGSEVEPIRPVAQFRCHLSPGSPQQPLNVRAS